MSRLRIIVGRNERLSFGSLFLLIFGRRQRIKVVIIGLEIFNVVVLGLLEVAARRGQRVLFKVVDRVTLLIVVQRNVNAIRTREKRFKRLAKSRQTQKRPKQILIKILNVFNVKWNSNVDLTMSKAQRRLEKKVKHISRFLKKIKTLTRFVISRRDFYRLE